MTGNKIELKKVSLHFVNEKGDTVNFFQHFVVINGIWLSVKCTSKDKTKKMLLSTNAEEVIFKDKQEGGELK